MEIAQATPDMFDRVYAVLREFGGALTKDDWRALLEYRFSDQHYRGWVGTVNGEVVGYLGAIFSERDGARFCGLTSWIVKREHRKGNLRLLKPMLELEDHTLLNFSASPFTAALFQNKLGFTALDEQLVLIPRFTGNLAPRGCTRVRDLERVLGPRELKLWRDHRPYGLCHLAIAGPEGHCYVVASKTTFRRLAVSFIHHISNPALFARAANVVQGELWREHHTLLTLVDARLLEGHRIRGAFRYRLAQPRLFRPGTPGPAHTIDSLYTELVLLNPRRWTFNH